MPIQSFEPVSGLNPKLLVLGSIPGIASLNAHQYYAHPRNAFWPIMCRYFRVELSLKYEDRVRVLTDCGVGLWDVLQQCERKGSLDSRIATHSIVPNPIDHWLETQPTVTDIILNGGKAAQVFKKHFKSARFLGRVAVHQCPSTSPAYAAMSQDEKFDRWSSVLDTLSF